MIRLHDCISIWLDRSRALQLCCAEMFYSNEVRDLGLETERSVCGISYSKQGDANSV